MGNIAINKFFLEKPLSKSRKTYNFAIHSVYHENKKQQLVFQKVTNHRHLHRRGDCLCPEVVLLQVIDDKYKTMADNNALRFVTQYPARGTVFDRNGQLLVFNEVTPGTASRA